jgi:hypothetical protein
MGYIWQLRFMEIPDYDFVIKLLYVIAAKRQFLLDYEYDWTRRRCSMDVESSMFPHSEIGSQMDVSMSY